MGAGRAPTAPTAPINSRAYNFSARLSTAIGLITQAPFTAAEIATAVLHGIEAGDAVIVPDDIAVSMVAMKRTDPEAYAVWGRDGAARDA